LVLVFGVGDVERGVEVLRRAQWQYPTDFWVNEWLGLHLAFKVRPARPEEAIPSLTAAVVLNPHSPGAYFNLGRALQDSGKHVEAERAYRKAIALKPDYAAPHDSLGSVLVDKGRPDEAMACYREAVRLKPTLPVAHYNLGNSLYHKGQLDEAVKEYREAIRLKPDDPVVHHNLGVVLHQKSQLEDSIKAYREAIRLKPDLVSAHYGLGNSLKGSGRADEAITAYREAIRLKPYDANAHNNLGVALSDMGRMDEAIVCYRKTLELDPKHVGAHNNLGNALQAKGQLREALTQYEQAILIAPHFSYLYASLASLLADSPQPELRDLKRALTLALKTVELEPKAGFALRILGLVHYRMGNWEAARSALERAYQLNDEPLREGDDCSGWFFLAMTYWRLGEKDQARRWHDRAVAWMEKYKRQDVDLKRSRAEAAELLGVKDPPPAKETSPLKP
jgi:tetratricopeptide (TPR) repeat protein